jgi:peptidoglycan glycosyltransferase
MNRQIVKLFAFIVVLFGVLVGFTSYWSVFDAQALKEKQVNKRPLFEAQQIRRGRILAADGSVIAKSTPIGRGASRRFVRHYPQGSLYGHPIGYSYAEYGSSEFEQFHNEELVGENSEFESILDQITGKKQEGNDIVTNIDTEAQKVALGALENAGFGAVVAIEPSTGEVKVMASNKPYDPNRIPDEIEQLYKDKGHILANDFEEDFGAIPLDTALTNSVNTWFAQLGQKVGQDKLFAMMEKFGFNATPPIDLPNDEVYNSGVYEERHTLTRNDPVDLGRLAIGQERLLATPLQMAMVASAVANGGKLMKPQIWNRVIDPDGRIVERLEPSEYSRPISGEVAEELTTAMEGVVSEGTGTNAAISGVPVAGKTGTAETPGNKACGGGEEENQAWFIGFALRSPRGASSTAATKCWDGSAAAAWPTSTWPRTPTCSGGSRSRSCIASSPRTANSSSASAARPRRRRG